MVIISDGKEGDNHGAQETLSMEAAHLSGDLVQSSLGTPEAPGARLEEEMGRSPKEYFACKLCSESTLMETLRATEITTISKSHQSLYRRAGSYEKLPAISVPLSSEDL